MSGRLGQDAGSAWPGRQLIASRALARAAANTTMCCSRAECELYQSTATNATPPFTRQIHRKQNSSEGPSTTKPRHALGTRACVLPRQRRIVWGEEDERKRGGTKRGDIVGEGRAELLAART